MLKRFLLPALCSALTLLDWSAGADLPVRLATAPQKGAVTVMLFDSAEGFEDFSAPVRVESIPADGSTTALTLTGIPAGEYALVVFHDENGNGRLDFNFIGIPKEPIGFANAYRPKGPPNFTRAILRIAGENVPPAEIRLARPLGDRGRVGVGAGVIARSSPYTRSTGNPVQVIPAVTYIGNRLQIYGPYAQFGLTGSGHTRLAASLAYRMGVYEEDDSPVLEGMDDRKATAMAGLRLQMNAPGGIDVEAGYAHDALDRIGGGAAQAGIARPVPWRSTRFTPSLAVHWTTARLVQHDYGVSSSEATLARPAYRPGDALSIEAGLGIFTEITPSLFGALRVGVEWFDDEVRHSPIVDDDHVLKGLVFITYML